MSLKFRNGLVVFALSAAFSMAAQQSSPGFRNFDRDQAKWDKAFLKVPDAAAAGADLKELTKAPHWASSPEDKATAEFVARKFRDAGLQTEIVPFRVLLNKPLHLDITATDAKGKVLFHGPEKEHVGPEYGGDPFQDDPRVLPPFNGSSGSGDVTAAVVYANYGTLADFDRLKAMGIDLHGKIVVVRYGANFRGIKVMIAQERGAAGVLIYSDPADDGYTRGDMYPRGAMHPETAVQRGSVQFLPLYPGDPETPGVASTMDLPDSKRILDPAKMNQPMIPSNPISYAEAAPMLQALDGKTVPHEWQGGLPFTYHVGGTDAVKVHMNVQQDYALRTIWDVIGIIPGSSPTESANWVVAGNHRDAWVYGAVDPNSGTAAMLESVHGIGELLKQGWKPKRTVVIASWDAEEEGLMGSTEWAEQHAAELGKAVAYFNTDVGVSGPSFDAAAVPSLKEFVRAVTKEVPSPAGGTVYEQWKKADAAGHGRRTSTADMSATAMVEKAAAHDEDVHIADLGSGSDYSPFIQHLGVPSTDIGSNGPYGVYHSVFDNYAWFVKNADPTFVYEQQQARVFGLEIIHMADVDVLPYDDAEYGRDIEKYVATQEKKAGDAGMTLDFAATKAAAKRFTAAGTAAVAAEGSTANPVKLNAALRAAESALLLDKGLPKRPWYKHAIYDPGMYTGYAAVDIPGVTEAVEQKDVPTAQEQLAALAVVLNRAAAVLEEGVK